MQEDNVQYNWEKDGMKSQMGTGWFLGIETDNIPELWSDEDLGSADNYSHLTGQILLQLS